MCHFFNLYLIKQIFYLERSCYQRCLNTNANFYVSNCVSRETMCISEHFKNVQAQAEKKILAHLL